VALTFEPTLTGLAAELTDNAFPEIVAFGLGAAAFPEAATETVLTVEIAGFAEVAFWIDVAGFAAGTTFTETAGSILGAIAPVVFTPFGEGLCAVAVFVGCTLTVAGAAGFCTAVGVCANAAADRSMSVPKVRMI
jgi:hypothetical protein